MLWIFIVMQLSSKSSKKQQPSNVHILLWLFKPCWGVMEWAVLLHPIPSESCYDVGCPSCYLLRLLGSAGPLLCWLLQHEHVYLCLWFVQVRMCLYVSTYCTQREHMYSMTLQDASRWLASATPQQRNKPRQTAGFSYWPHRWQPSWECQL